MTAPSELDKIVSRLVASPMIRFDRAALVPASPGLYAIYTTAGECLHAGKSANLRNRLLRDHFTGGGKGVGSDLIQKLQDRERAIDRTSAKGFMESSCVFRCIEVPDDEMRDWAEHRLLSELQPVWGR